jgi:glycerol-3-phosphate dehydrogenase
VFDLDQHGGAPILSIFGGKITTYRKLAEHALEKLDLTEGKSWTGTTPLPGGDIDPARFDTFFADCMARYAWFGPEGIRRLCRAYGTRIDHVLGKANGLEDLGEHFGGDLYAAELDYLVREEFACSADDVLWRRSKLGLRLDQADQARVKTWFADRLS